jgi:serine/threonine-protein kinase PpkA
MPDFPEIPGYRIKKLLGRGGMANVYLGVQENLSRMVAIKILIPGMFQNRRVSKRFLKEARTLSRLLHPNIVTIHDVGQVNNSHYIVMEYLQESLKEKVKKKRKIPPDEAFHLVLQIADALYYAHEKGIIHRDIKPENILFRKDGTPVVLDFGIAKAMDSKTKLTKTGMSIGTPQYMSPEQCNAQKLDGRSDIYSLGVVLYEMLTGKLPYTAKDTLGVVMQHLRDPVPKLPRDLKKYQLIIDKMMAKNKRSRVRSREGLNQIIKKLLNLETKTRKTKDVKKPRQKMVDSRTQLTVLTQSKSDTSKKIEKKKVTKKPGKAGVKSKKKKKSRAAFFIWILLFLAATIFVYQTVRGQPILDFFNPLVKFFKAIGDFLF